MNQARKVALSKYLSHLLRHHPEAAGLRLEAGGWVAVNELLAGVERVGRGMTRAELEAVVAGGGKPRFRFSENGDRIRANYGHSVPVDIDLQPVRPPQRLFHGTARRSLRSIRRHGLRPRGRTMVHLSAEEEGAHATGGRHGRPVVLIVLAGRLHKHGHPFFRPAPGVWLTPQVPPEFLDIPSDP